jgi:hypothetical protein
MRHISAPSHGTKTSRNTQPAFAQPLSELSLNRSNRRLHPAYYAAEIEVFTALSTLKAIARRVRSLQYEAAEHEKAI